MPLLQMPLRGPFSCWRARVELIRYTLDNGLVVLLKPNHTAPVVACNVWVGVGSADELPREAGLAHVHEHMLFKGTSRRGVGEIAREIEGAGGQINAFTSFDQTCYYVVMSSRYLDTGLDILTDAIQHSSFEAGELARELEVIQEEIKRGEDSPTRVASLKLFETAFQHHPYGLPVIGTSASVGSFQRQDVLDFFHKHYVPNNMAVVLTGDFDVEHARQRIAHYFGDFAAKPYERMPRDSEPPQGAPRCHVQPRPIQEAHLRLGFHIPHGTHEDIPALDLLGIIMGHGESSALYQSILLDKELVNSIYAGAYTPRDNGLFVVQADYQLSEETAHSHGDVSRHIFEDIFRFRDMPVTALELQRARTILESQAIYSKQTAEGMAMKLGHYQMVAGDPAFEALYYERLARVSAQDIQRVARTWLTLDNVNAVLTYPEDATGFDVAHLEKNLREAWARVAAEAVDAAITTDSQGFLRLDLPDGPRLIIQEDNSVETFACRAVALGGLRFESAATNGANELLAEMLTRGTHQRSAMDIARTTESMASSLAGLSGRNTLGMGLNGLSRFFEPSFEILADCLWNSTVAGEEFERERKLQLQSIRSRQDQLGSVNFDRFARAFYGPHPYAMPTGGTAESVQALAPVALRHYLHERIQPQDLVVVAVGDVNARHVVDLVERFFVRPEAPATPTPVPPSAPVHGAPRLVVGDLEKNQAHVMVGFHAPSMTSRQRYALDVLDAILSGQGGRLFFELRDRQSLAYSVYASYLPGLEASAYTINIGTSPEKIDQAVAGIIGEVQRLRHEPPTQAELDSARRNLIGNHDIGLQTNSARAMTFALDELYGLGFKRTFDYAEHIQAVTPGDIEALVQEFLDPRRIVASITKPASTNVSTDLLERHLAALA